MILHFVVVLLFAVAVVVAVVAVVVLLVSLLLLLVMLLLLSWPLSMLLLELQIDFKGSNYEKGVQHGRRHGDGNRCGYCCCCCGCMFSFLVG